MAEQAALCLASQLDLSGVQLSDYPHTGADYRGMTAKALATYDEMVSAEVNPCP